MSESVAQPKRIALIGLGNMGGPIGSQLIGAGHTVVGFDLSQKALEDFASRGGDTATTAAEAATGADAAIFLLPDSNVVDSVLGELLDAGALTEASTVIDMSSSDPERTRANGERLGQRGIVFLDAPVSGGVRGAKAATLTIMVGGDDATFAAWEPVLSELGHPIHVGGIGTGHAVKALNNLLSATHLWATSEAVLVGERFGIDPSTFLEVVNGSSGRSGSSEVKWPKFILTEAYDSGFSARLMLKDAKIATGLARNLGLPTALGEELVAEWTGAAGELPAAADHTEVARWLKERAAALAAN